MKPAEWLLCVALSTTAVAISTGLLAESESNVRALRRASEVPDIRTWRGVTWNGLPLERVTDRPFLVAVVRAGVGPDLAGWLKLEKPLASRQVALVVFCGDEACVNDSRAYGAEKAIASYAEPRMLSAVWSVRFADRVPLFSPAGRVVAWARFPPRDESEREQWLKDVYAASSRTW